MKATVRTDDMLELVRAREAAEGKFNEVSEPMLVDAAAYDLMAAELRLRAFVAERRAVGWSTPASAADMIGAASGQVVHLNARLVDLNRRIEEASNGVASLRCKALVLIAAVVLVEAILVCLILRA